MATIAQLTALKNGRTTGTANRIAAERDLWAALINETCKLYEVKEIDVNLTLHPTYITDNFDITGLGIGDMEGFAICNGDNGTRDRTGRAGVGYGTGYTDIGLQFGSANSVLPLHTHKTTTKINPSGEYSPTLKYTTAYRPSGGDVQYGLQGTATVPDAGDTTEEGVSGVGKNIPPSIITLMIQRIA